jgi:hypothetical protein
MFKNRRIIVRTYDRIALNFSLTFAYRPNI